jgi:hypothetical protein
MLLGGIVTTPPTTRLISRKGAARYWERTTWTNSAWEISIPDNSRRRDFCSRRGVGSAELKKPRVQMQQSLFGMCAGMD